ncbi:MAG: hypothetical protein HYZ63_03785 [Candidatus Andersenbacteria bacterium]|nr:hypothetical protein [Candidatus Andersenbacteria bacterium]
MKETNAMSESNGHVGFTHEAEVLVKTIRTLGEYVTAANEAKAKFQATLEALGMDQAEAASYWPMLQPHNKVCEEPPMEKVRTNSQLAQKFGISLQSEHTPRNLLLYRVFECHLPDILSVQVTGSKHIGQAPKGHPEARRVVFSRLPRDEDGDPMRVCQLFLGREPHQLTRAFVQASEPLRQALPENNLGSQLAHLLVNLQMLLPPPATTKLVSKVLQAGLAGEEITLAGAFCPDYAYKQTGNPQIPYVYTFDGVGEGVGLVAQQFVRIVPPLSQFLTKANIKHRVVLGIGDFEADSQANLKRVNLDRDEFVRRCSMSLEAFREQVALDIPLELELCLPRANGRFHRYADEARQAMAGERFGCMADLYDDLAEILARIPRQYRTFYERWHGTEMSDKEISHTVYSQGGEYAALARIYAEDFGQNVILLAGDRPEMHRFNAFFQVVPTLCAKRAY